MISYLLGRTQIPLVVIAVAFATQSAGAQPAPAAPTTQQAKVDAFAQALGKNPKFKKLSPKYLQAVTEFVIGNTLFAMLHELGHADHQPAQDSGPRQKRGRRRHIRRHAADQTQQRFHRWRARCGGEGLVHDRSPRHQDRRPGALLRRARPRSAARLSDRLPDGGQWRPEISDARRRDEASERPPKKLRGRFRRRIGGVGTRR